MIRIVNLSRAFDGDNVVNGVSITLDKQENLVVLGPSGGGKSTLLRLIAGFEQPDAGTIEIDDILISSPERVIAPNQRHMGMIFQDLALWPHMTVFDNVAFGLHDQRLGKSILVRKVINVLDQVSLVKHKLRYPHQLSGGEKQRLAIARALVTTPSYLLMDEPFSSLDPVLKIEMIELLRKLKSQYHYCIVYVTHNLDEALHLADRIAIMRRGEIGAVIEKEGLASLTQDGLLAWYKEHI